MRSSDVDYKVDENCTDAGSYKSTPSVRLFSDVLARSELELRFETLKEEEEEASATNTTSLLMVHVVSILFSHFLLKKNISLIEIELRTCYINGGWMNGAHIRHCNPLFSL